MHPTPQTQPFNEVADAVEAIRRARADAAAIEAAELLRELITVQRQQLARLDDIRVDVLNIRLRAGRLEDSFAAGLAGGARQ